LKWTKAAGRVSSVGLVSFSVSPSCSIQPSLLGAFVGARRGRRRRTADGTYVLQQCNPAPHSLAQQLLSFSIPTAHLSPKNVIVPHYHALWWALHAGKDVGPIDSNRHLKFKSGRNGTHLSYHHPRIPHSSKNSQAMKTGNWNFLISYAAYAIFIQA
jgi:hypothetical protein